MQSTSGICQSSHTSNNYFEHCSACKFLLGNHLGISALYLTILIIETHTVKLKVRYENGEEGCVGINKVEPGDNFESPKEGNKVCCKVSGLLSVGGSVS